MDDLKPCPFCGNIPRVYQCSDDQWFVDCGDDGTCHVFVYAHDYSNREEAVKRWNTRQEPSR